MKRKLFALLLLVSGFAGISYEILYGRILGNLIGDQFAVSAAILITFLLGIGLGSRFAWLLWPYLWLIEAAIGLCGAAFVFGTDALDVLLYSSLPLLPSGLSGSIIACVLLLIVPAFLIGCSVPLFAGYMSRLTSGPVFSWVYAVYNVGAALTALLIEYLLIRWFGISGAMLGFVALNLFIAVVLRFGFDSISKPCRAAARSIGHISRRQWLGLVPVSIASAVFQLFMIKLAEMILGPFRESFALVLSIILLGIAVGSMLVRLFGLKFQTVLLMAMFGLLFLITAVEPVGYLYARFYDLAAVTYLGSVLLKWACLTLLMGLPAIAFGATIPALLQDEQGDVSRQSGQLLFISSMSNVAGFLLMVFLLHRYLDYGVQLLVISLLTALSLLLYVRANCKTRERRSASPRWPISELEFRSMEPPCTSFHPENELNVRLPLIHPESCSWLVRKPLRPVWIAGLVFLTTGAVFYQHWDEDLLYISYTKFRSVDKLNAARESFDFPEKFKGYQDVFSINWMNGKPYFFINGYTSIPLNNPSEKVVGALSSIYAPRADQALVLGLGSGATASVVGQLFEATDVVEINPVVRENLFRMKRWNFDIESNPKVNIIVDDAIHFTKVSNKKYDLILNTVTTPLYFSSAKLYTRDFFQVVKKRMFADAIYVTWMDARVGDKGVDIILNTIADSFRYSALLYIKSSYFLLICSDQPIVARQSERLNKHPVLHADFLLQHGILSDWLKYQLLHTQVLDLIADPSQPLNEANYPALEFEMARLRGRGIPDFKSRLRQAMNIADVRDAMDTVSPAFPADLVMHTRRMLKNSSLTRRWESLAKADSDQYEELHSLALEDYYLKLVAQGAGADAYHKFGYQLMRSKKYEAALTVFRKVLEMDERHNNTHFNMGACYEYMEDFPQALQHYQKEAELDPDDEDVPYRIGRVHVKMKSYKQAVTSLQSALARMGPDAAYRVYDYLGRAYEGLGLEDKARFAFQKADDKRKRNR